jgi:selenophosphate synthetase-related protein
MTEAPTTVRPTGSRESPEGELADIVAAVRNHPGLVNKSSIGLVTDVLGTTDWVTGPGDDAAAVDALGAKVVACGEAMWPPFVAADPFGAGFAAVLTNINDLAATGGVPLGIVDTVVASEDAAKAALEGMRYACELYDVRILGGHLTPHDGPPAVSAFAVGTTRNVLSITHVAPGQSLLVACSLEGGMREDFPFFRSFTERGRRCAGDIRVLSYLAESGACVAAKDISMAGLIGSLAMLLEFSAHGVTVDLDALPVPEGVPLTSWLTCFPSFGFLLCAAPDRERDCVDAFTERGLSCAAVGRIDETGEVAISRGGVTASVLRMAGSPVTRLGRERSAS